ncbi:MAG TPA: glycine--tRNA ligase [Candidatus Paceibacterota bacterium]|nr:glycine--tRNA ligase [Candidatus Paceibacterota bacterium]
MAKEQNKLEKIVALAKRRGFVFPGSEIYGGLANSWDYGPLGVELKNNIQQLWWKFFVHERDDMVGLDAAIIMNPKVWEASGHVSGFTDPLIECKLCHERVRADKPEMIAEHEAEHAKKDEKTEWTEPKQFNLLFPVKLGVSEETALASFLRGEIAQAMFVNFKNVLNSTRVQIPFGIASQGKAFRNEITPGNFIFRTREFDLMEFEYFIKESDWEKTFEMWHQEMYRWIEMLGIDKSHVHDLEKKDLAHYSKRTVDLEYDFPFGREELYGLAYRTDFDLKNHMDKSGEDLSYVDPETGEKFLPHVVEPTFGLTRTVLAVLCEAYHEEEERTVLKLSPKLAPFKVAVFPLLKNKPELVEKARQIHKELKKHFNVAWDDRGNIGKRYFSQDEIGTPFCVTIDFDTLEKDDTVTVRDRDSMKQERIPTSELVQSISKKLE